MTRTLFNFPFHIFIILLTRSNFTHLIYEIRCVFSDRNVSLNSRPNFARSSLSSACEFNSLRHMLSKSTSFKQFTLQKCSHSENEPKYAMHLVVWLQQSSWCNKEPPYSAKRNLHLNTRINEQTGDRHTVIRTFIRRCSLFVRSEMLGLRLLSSGHVSALASALRSADASDAGSPVQSRGH